MKHEIRKNIISINTIKLKKDSKKKSFLYIKMEVLRLL